MTRSEVASMLSNMASSIGCEYAYHHFEEGQNPELPFLIFEYPNSNNFIADGITYSDIETLNIYLCSETLNLTNESKIKNALNQNGIAFDLVRTYIKKERMYQTTFTTEVILNG